MRRVGRRYACFRHSRIEGAEGGFNDRRLRGIGDMNIAASRVRMLTDMPEPCSAASRSKRVSLPLATISIAHTCARETGNSSPAPRLAIAELALPCSRRAMSNTSRHSSVTWRGTK